MADIMKSVTSAFSKARDSRIDFHIVEKGASSLLTGVYDPNEDQTSKFYKKPDITNGGETTKAAIIYGEVMISSTIVDAGVSSSTLDPASVVKTYRFVTGDGEQGGVVVGPNGSPLENVYVKDPNGIPQPVVKSDGRVSFPNMVLAASAGAAITSIPKIWDAIKSSTPSSHKTSTVDPITGKPIASRDAQATANLAKQIPLGQLSDVNDAGKGDNTVLVYNPEDGLWIPKSMSQLLAETEALSSDTICGGAGGAGGTGGNGGNGGNGGSAGGGTPPDPCSPETNFEQTSCITPPAITKSGMVLLPASSNTTVNQYTQTIPVIGTRGIEFHFFASGCGKEATWNVSNGDITNCDGTSPFVCLEDPKKEEVQKPATSGSSIAYLVEASFKFKLCLTTNICGSEYLIYSTTVTETALSHTSYTFIGKTVLWENTKIGTLLNQYPGQIFNSSNPNVKVYLYRTDECDSEFDLYFEGYKRLIGDSYFRGVQKAKTTNTGTTPKPKPRQVKPDDGKFPDEKPTGGGMGEPSCPEDAALPTDPTLGTPGTPGSPGSSGGDGTCGEVTVAPPKAQPTIILTSPCATQYGKKTTPPNFDPVTLPKAKINPKIADTHVSVVYSFVTGTGSFQISGSIPGTVTAFPTEGQLLLTGPSADVETASEHVQVVPASNSLGEINYKLVLTNAENMKAGTTCVIMPNQIKIENSQSATAKVCISSSSTGGTGTISVDVNGTIKELTNGAVPFNTNANTTAIDMAASITSNVATKNALDPTDPAWLPKYTAAVTASGEITISAPAAGGADFNNVQLTKSSTSGFVFGDCVGTFLGGVTQNIADFLKNNVPNWDKVTDVLVGVGGNVLGQVINNVIMNKIGQVEISIPADQNVDLTFLYHGRVVQVPNEYNASSRTGHPTSYDTWSGTWKNQWTNNPAWCVWDFITNKKYGMGNILKMSSAQREDLLRDIFRIGYYSDDDVVGDDGTTKRFSCNTVITDGTRLQILEQLCSVFFGSFYIHNGGIRISNDMPDSEIAFLVNQDNASDFERALTSTKNFVNKVFVSYIEPSNFYTEEIVIAEIDTAIAQVGERSITTTAFGCTNADEARRRAKWILDTETENAQTISYNGGFDHYNLRPGQIVEFYDSNARINQRRAGRVKSQSGVNVVLDAPIISVAGDYFSLMMSNGVVHKTTIASISGVNVVLATAPPVAALPYATFIAASAATGRKLYKVIKRDKTQGATFAMTLQSYNPSKF